MRDEHRGAAGRGESANDIEQLIHLGRRQYRGGLVEQKNGRVGRERLHDLEPLTQADAEPLDPSVGIEWKSDLLAQLLHAQAESDGLDAPTRRQCHVLRDGERGDRGEVLMHHADAESSREAGGQGGAHDSADANDTGIRSDQPRGDVHQGALAGSVLTEQRVQLAGEQREIGSAQRLHGAEAAVDPLELERGDHSPVGWSWNSHSRSNRSPRWEASACTPRVSVA